MNPFFLLQTAAPPPAGGSPLTPFLFQLALISGIIYFLMIRPQQKQRKAHEERLRSLRRGDQVVTGGGIIGEIVHMKDSTKDGSPAPSMEDPITIKSAESRLVVERGRIARVITPAGGNSAS